MPFKCTFHERRLPFSLRTIKKEGGKVDVYEIPEEKKEKVLRSLYPFHNLPPMEREMEDLHQRRTFQVKDFMVIREWGTNLLVSPYYLESGGTVIDWIPVRRERRQK